MEKATNKYITVAYKLYTIEDGERELSEEAPAAHPFQFISDMGMTLDYFEEQIKNLNKGETFNFTIPAEEAYGPYDEDHVIDLPKQLFLIDGEFDEERVVEGAILPLQLGNGQIVNGSVAEVKEDVVVMDMNHPFAGCDLNFVGQIIESRPATQEEKDEATRMMSGSCGCGGCGGNCGSGCNCEGDCCEG